MLFTVLYIPNLFHNIYYFVLFLQGYIESGNPSNGCHNMTMTMFPPNTTYDKIALINDTDCNFMTKVCLFFIF